MPRRVRNWCRYRRARAHWSGNTPDAVHTDTWPMFHRRMERRSKSPPSPSGTRAVAAFRWLACHCWPSSASASSSPQHSTCEFSYSAGSMAQNSAAGANHAQHAGRGVLVLNRNGVIALANGSVVLGGDVAGGIRRARRCSTYPARRDRTDGKRSSVGEGTQDTVPARAPVVEDGVRQLHAHSSATMRSPRRWQPSTIRQRGGEGEGRRGGKQGAGSRIAGPRSGRERHRHDRVSARWQTDKNSVCVWDRRRVGRVAPGCVINDLLD